MFRTKFPNRATLDLAAEGIGLKIQATELREQGINEQLARDQVAAADALSLELRSTRHHGAHLRATAPTLKHNQQNPPKHSRGGPA
jgi:hypothetical protein